VRRWASLANTVSEREKIMALMQKPKRVTLMEVSSRDAIAFTAKLFIIMMIPVH